MRLKNTACVLCVVLTASLAFTAGAGATGRTLYKWVDEQGVTHYGDRIPPEYAAQEQHVINSQGVEINRLEAQKTAEQMAAEDQKKQDAEQRQNRDRNLLTPMRQCRKSSGFEISAWPHRRSDQGHLAISRNTERQAEEAAHQ